MYFAPYYPHINHILITKYENRAFVIGLEIQYRQKLSHEKQLLYIRHKHETNCAGQVVILSMFISYIKKILLKKNLVFNVTYLFAPDLFHHRILCSLSLYYCVQSEFILLCTV
jgi:hypothetical protein